MGDATGQDAFDSTIFNRIPIAKYDDIGDTHHGEIVDAMMVQSRLYDEDNPGRGDLLWWHDKKPKAFPKNPDDPDEDRVMELHIVIQTDERMDEDDDGRREIWINKRLQKKSFLRAWKASGADKPRIGGWLRQTRIEEGEPLKKGGNKPRGWDHDYKTPEQFVESGPNECTFTPSGTVKVKAGKDADNPFA